MARVRKYADNAEKQAAYRQRLRAKKEASKPDKLLYHLHEAIKEAASEGEPFANMLIGVNPVETARNVQSHFEQFSSSMISRRLGRL